MIIDYDMNKD